MNLRTTLALIVLVVLGGVVWKFGPRLPQWLDPSPAAPVADAGTVSVFEHQLTADKINHIRILRAGQPWLVLEKHNGVWVLPGGWETREAEVNALIQRLGSLRSRFEPLPLTGEDGELKQYGLEKPPFEIVVKAGPTEYRLEFGEGDMEDNRFFRPTYVRLRVGDEARAEVIQLGPGLLATLGQPREYYQKRRLFPIRRETRAAGGREKTERLNADSLTVEQSGGTRFTLTRVKDEWRLTYPTVDRLDAERTNQVLEAVGNLRAERFVTTSPADVIAMIGAPALIEGGIPAAFTAAAWGKVMASREWLRFRAGLEKPERTIRVQSARGPIVLQIGNVSGTRAASTPPQPPDMGTQSQREEEFRYARLETKELSEDLVFEIKSDKLKEVFTTPFALRDTKLARFESDNVRRIEIVQGGGKVILRREKKRWQIENPDDHSVMLAEENKVRELLSGLSVLSSQDRENEELTATASVVGSFATAGGPLVTLYPGRLRVDHSAAFANPLATVTLTVVEKNELTEAETSRTIKLTIGAQDEAARQLFVKVDDWPRIEVVSSDAWAQLRRPALAYRGKLFDFNIADVQHLSIDWDGKPITLVQSKGQWRLKTPADVEADPGKVGQVLSLLSSLEPTEYVDETPSASALDSIYGLKKVLLSVTIQVGSKLKTLSLGNKRAGKPDYYARLEGSPSVFAVAPELPFSLRADALSYLPLQLWRLEPEQLKSVRVDKESGEGYSLQRQKSGAWKVAAGLSESPALETAVRPMIEVLGNPHCERYEAFSIDDPKKFGFDKPYLKLALLPAKSDEPQREIVVGKKVKESDPDRYARRADSPLVFVLRGDLIESVNRGFLDLLDTLLLNVPLENVESVQVQSGDAKMLLRPDDRTWKVFEATPSAFVADENALASLRGSLFNLRAERFIAYGPKLDLPKHGLDKPAAKLIVSIKEEGRTRQATLAIGADAPGRPGQRYAHLEGSPGIVLLTANDTRVLTRNYLDYVDHRMLSLAPDRVTNLSRQKGTEALEIAKQDDEWRLLKPQDQRADDKVVEALLRQLTDLRAAKVAEYPLKDAKKYGLDTPFAVLTVKLVGSQHVLTLGSEVVSAKGQRYAKVDATPTVFVLPANLIAQLEASPIAFRSRAIARFSDADRIVLERGPRQAVISRVGGNWTLTAPLETKVENEQVDDFLNKAARLVADELVADKPADLKPYGLDRPTARWRFQYDDRVVLDLVLGKRDATGKRCYATLGKDGLVFLLSPDMTAKALGEFRDRTVWTMPVDAAMVDTLKFTRDGKTVTLTKDGTVWSSVEKKDAKVNSETVNDTLAALVNLKLERYAVDKGADKKLFGLDPPVLIIEATAGDKQTVLHLGRFEGDSKQAYAAVPEKDRTDVFILSEADTAKLTRDLDALGKMLPPKPKLPVPERSSE